MDIAVFVRGLIIGFSIAAPVGPIGVLCIRRTLADGRAAGLISGLGAATADAFYGCVAGFGLSFVSTFLVAQQTWLRLIGGAFLIYLGIKTFLTQPASEAAAASGRGLAGAYVSTFALTLTNPVTILAFVFGGLGTGGSAFAILRSRYRVQTDIEREKYITALEERNKFLEEDKARRDKEQETTRRQLHNLEGKFCFLQDLVLRQCKHAEIDPVTGGCRNCALGMAYGQGGN